MQQHNQILKLVVITLFVILVYLTEIFTSQDNLMWIFIVPLNMLRLLFSLCNLSSLRYSSPVIHKHQKMLSFSRT
uniref:Uncharacterized protein n=1 Tax=Arundo donax TaxID=35708 RepID=A0A0A9K1E6_ARUDO